MLSERSQSKKLDDSIYMKFYKLQCLVTEINQWLPGEGTVGWITERYKAAEGDRYVHYHGGDGSTDVHVKTQQVVLFKMYSLFINYTSKLEKC